ncbi:MAG: carbohydrate ABC transporter permease [Actinomycetes bacterium]|jgi:multiple sugar transport system permease protein/raffinose/stachyose/melibiose transport system permease protein
MSTPTIAVAPLSTVETPSRRKRKQPLRSALIFLSMVLIAIVMLYPFYFMVDTSLQSNDQFLHGGGHSLDSWSSLNSALPWGRQMVNSGIVCAFAIVVILIVSSLAGFSFAKLQFRMSTFVLLGVVAAMLIPVQSIIIPVYVNVAHLHLLNTYVGAVIVYAALGTPFATFLMTAYYRSIPDDVIEAGIIDGLSYSKVFLRVALPLSVPALITITVLQFIQIWDDLLVGLLFLQNPEQRTITVALGALAAGRTTDVPVLMAGSIMSAVPAIAVYLVFQRFLINGLTAGIGK